MLAGACCPGDRFGERLQGLQQDSAGGADHHLHPGDGQDQGEFRFF